MLSALRNFVFVTLGMIICLILGWILLRSGRFDQPIPVPLDHPFLRAIKQDVVAYPPTTLATPPPPSAAVLWIDVRPRFDGTLVVSGSDRPSDAEAAPKFADVLARFPTQRMILSFHGYRDGVKDAAIAAIEAAKAGDRALIQSPEDGFLKDMREERPKWIFGTSVPQLTITKMLASIGLAKLAPLRGDVLVIEESALTPQVWTDVEDLVAEGHRRGMKVYAGPVTAADAKKLRDLGVEGILTTEPEKLLAQETR